MIDIRSIFLFRISKAGGISSGGVAGGAGGIGAGGSLGAAGGTFSNLGVITALHFTLVKSLLSFLLLLSCFPVHV